jgi:hypothetical protein
MKNKKCDIYDPLVYDCTTCKDFDKCKHSLKYFHPIPDYLIDGHLMQLKPAAFKVFLYLNRLANYDTENKDYGKCTATYAKIAEKTGVSNKSKESKTNIRKYIKELKDCGLIDYDDIDYNQDREASNHKGHEYTILHYIKKKELLAASDQPEEADKEPDDRSERNEAKAAPRQFKAAEDEYPKTTERIKKLWQEYELQLDNPKYDENNFRKAAKRFEEFIEKYGSKIDFVDYGDHGCSHVRSFIKALLYDADENKSKITTSWLCTNKMFKYRLPKYLHDNGYATCFRNQFNS